MGHVLHGSATTTEATQTAIRAFGAALLPAAYSPDLNPIEQVFAKLKTRLRMANEQSVEPNWKRIRTLRDAVSPSEYANDVRNNG